jgi:pimeloyl-ACP methyl ester carboxylesterase
MAQRENGGRRRVATIFFLGGLWLSCGCSLPPPSTQDRLTNDVPHAQAAPMLYFPERLDRGYTLVLPGVSGDYVADHGVVTGLKKADVSSAIEFYDWTTGTGRRFYHLCGIERNRAQAQKIASKIVNYHERYPGRPVNLIGYSGGGGVAVLALEALPPDHRVTNAILLAPSLARDYDLRLAMCRTEHGIHNYYSRLDVPVLMVISTAAGNTDGHHKLPGGAVGFDVPKTLDSAERKAYAQRLQQHEYRLSMVFDGHIGGHLGWATPTFVARHVAPLIGRSEAALGVADLSHR